MASRTKESARPQVLVIASQKGGSSKTTLAVHLAVHATLHGLRTVIVDIDPQESASTWRDAREASEPLLVTSTVGQLEQVLTAAADDRRRLVILDTPPHAGEQLAVAMRFADLVLVPCKATSVDLRALPATMELVRRSGRPAGIVLTDTPAWLGIVDEARKALLVSYPGVPVLPVAMGHRAAFHHAMNDGRAVVEYAPKSKAAAEIAAIYRWCQRTLTDRT